MDSQDPGAEKKRTYRKYLVQSERYEHEDLLLSEEAAAWRINWFCSNIQVETSDI